MKKFIFTLILISFQLSTFAQTVNVHFKNGQQVQYNADNIDYIDFSKKAEEPSLSAGTAVDLGLSVYWASCNVGAEKPEDYGDFYAWGETKPKDSYTIDKYSYYNSKKDEYIDIGQDISGTEYDAATVNLGNDWRMPTQSEAKELSENCTWEWTQINGVNGYKVTGKNGNSIFLPSAGWRHNAVGGKLLPVSEQKKEGTMCWLSNTNGTGSSDNALFLRGDIQYGSRVGTYYRYAGYTIRPVTKKSNASGGNTDHSQDYLVTNKVTASYGGGSIISVNGLIKSGSVLIFSINNKSNESIKLKEIRLIDGNTGTVSDNMLSVAEEIPAGQSVGYELTVGPTGIYKPKCRFTYSYNNRDYTVETQYIDY